VVVEDDGQYYVSPVRTVAGLGIDVLRTLQPARPGPTHDGDHVDLDL
jgi:hypothetical protein